MRPIPSQETVIRFVAFYGHGFDVPLTHLVLGNGYIDTGNSHGYLATTYGKAFLRKGSSGVIPLDTYAGYLYVEGEEIKIFSGGSQSMGIKEDEAKNTKLLEDLNTTHEGLKRAIVHLFPHIIFGEVEDVMLASGA
jgi:hypothetical protein